MKAKILIVEDQFIEANSLQMILENAGYLVCSIARSVPMALEIIEEEKPDMVLLDIYLQGDLTGIDLALTLREKDLAFIYLSANSNRMILDAAKATKPYGFLVKPFREQDVLIMLDVAWYLHQVGKQNLGEEGNKLVADAPESIRDWPTPIVCQNKKMMEIIRMMKLVAASDTSVLILGESGTGKELVAQDIHRLSARNKKPLVIVNCGALPAGLIESELFGHVKGAFTGANESRSGKFEQADGGTIFLDEIGELPLAAQVRFLRVLQEQEIERVGGFPKKINVRVIAATNRDLEEEILQGRFRMDLYYRLNVFPIAMPTLRERPEDIRLLAEHFVRKYNKKAGKRIEGLSESVLQQLNAYSWPGNVRELENIIERSVLLTTTPQIDQITLPTDVQSVPRPASIRLKTMLETERDHILEVLKSCDGQLYGKGGAAEILDINVSTLISRMKKLGIQKEVRFKG